MGHKQKPRTTRHGVRPATGSEHFDQPGARRSRRARCRASPHASACPTTVYVLSIKVRSTRADITFWQDRMTQARTEGGVSVKRFAVEVGVVVFLWIVFINPVVLVGFVGRKPRLSQI